MDRRAPRRAERRLTPQAPTDRTVRSGDQAWDMEKLALFFVVLAGVLVLDVSTKLMVQQNFHLYQQVDIVGEYLRLTYIYNPGAAFGIQLGEYSREIFLVLSLVALAALAAMYWFTPAGDRVRLLAIALICGGAVGNLIDRIRSEAGVVDFIDIGVGDIRWPVFNVADMAVTTGAIILALSLWREEQGGGDVA
ncbi:MAG TPA: signal peptidase II [Longimicrobiales bacterium]|nr:signal peptidase II [Longimicrobiales bacterium]